MDEPMVPLLYEHLQSILSSLLEKVVVQKLFDDNFSLKATMNIKLSNINNLKLPKDILNSAAKEALQKIKNLSYEKLIELKYQCRKFILESCKKLIGRSRAFPSQQSADPPLPPQKEQTRSFF